MATSSALGAFNAIAALPAGAMIDYAGTAAPAGWLMCDGAAISRTVYAALFSAIGTAYGTGDGSTTFNLPDYRGRFPRYMDNMGTVAGAASRDTGRVLGAAQTEATKRPTVSFTAGSSSVSGTVGGSDGTHAHGVTDPGHNHVQGGQQAGITTGGYSVVVVYNTGTRNATGEVTDSRTTGISVNSTSSGHGHSYSLTAAGQTITGGGDVETRPINLSCNRIIKY